MSLYYAHSLEISDLCPFGKGIYRSPNISPLRRFFEQQIDNLVYRLYNLTYNEVKVIEPEFPLSKAEYEGDRDRGSKVMPDIFTPEKRTSIMSSVRNKNTLPELIVQSLLRDIGVEYEREKKLLNCRPDIIISDMKKVIFIHGCLWHGHDCKRGQLPETNRSFWENKIAKNREHDLRNYDKLKAAGWNYLLIWGCEIKKRNLDGLIEKIEKFLS